MSVVKVLRKIESLSKLEKLTEDNVLEVFKKNKISYKEYEFLLNNIYLINNLIHNLKKNGEEN